MTTCRISWPGCAKVW